MQEVGGTLTVIALTLTVIALILSKLLQRIVVVTSLLSSTVLQNGGITILSWWFGAHSCTRQQAQCTRSSMRSLAAHLSGDAFGAWHVVIITAILIQERGWIIVIIDAALFGGHWHRLAERWVHAATGRSQLPLQRNVINQADQSDAFRAKPVKATPGTHQEVHTQKLQQTPPSSCSLWRSAWKMTKWMSDASSVVSCLFQSLCCSRRGR